MKNIISTIFFLTTLFANSTYADFRVTDSTFGESCSVRSLPICKNGRSVGCSAIDFNGSHCSLSTDGRLIKATCTNSMETKSTLCIVDSEYKSMVDNSSSSSYIEP